MTEYSILDDESTQSGIVVTPEAQESLRTAATWSGFLAILGFIMVGFMAIGGLMFFAAAGIMNSALEETGIGFPVWILPVFYLGISAAYFFPILFLYRFSTHIKSAIRNQRSSELTHALNNLGKHYKWIGIAVVVLLGFYLVFSAAFMSMFNTMTNGTF